MTWIHRLPGGMCVYLVVPYMSFVKYPKGHSVHLLCHNKTIPLGPPYLYDSFDIINANNHEISAINEVRPDLCKQCRICQHKACYWGRGVHDMGCQVVQAVIITGSCIHRHTQRAMLFYV